MPTEIKFKILYDIKIDIDVMCMDEEHDLNDFDCYLSGTLELEINAEAREVMVVSNSVDPTVLEYSPENEEFIKLPTPVIEAINGFLLENRDQILEIAVLGEHDLDYHVSFSIPEDEETIDIKAEIRKEWNNP